MKETVHESIVPVIERINAAEKAAAEISAEAETQAAAVRRACAEEIEKLEKEFSARMKSLAAETALQAEKDGEAQAAAILGEAEKECQRIASTAEKRRDRACKAIVAKILGTGAEY